MRLGIQFKYSQIGNGTFKGILSCSLIESSSSLKIGLTDIDSMSGMGQNGVAQTSQRLKTGSDLTNSKAMSVFVTRHTFLHGGGKVQRIIVFEC